MTTMKAAVIHEAGGPEVLKIESLPIPTPQSGEVLIRVKAFGLNRSELFTRQGHSPSVKFPRVLGIEAVGLVEEAPGSEFRKGDIVATAMGGMGRQFDGGYAEYTCVPATQVQRRQDRTRLGNARRHPGDAADGVGLAVQVASSRKRRASADPRRHDLSRAGGRGDRQEPRRLRRGDDSQPRPRKAAAGQRRRSGVHRYRLDRRTGQGGLSGGVDKVLELVGTTTLKDSLRCAKQRGIVCMTVFFFFFSLTIPRHSSKEAQAQRQDFRHCVSIPRPTRKLARAQECNAQHLCARYGWRHACETGRRNLPTKLVCRGRRESDLLHPSSRDFASMRRRTARLREERRRSKPGTFRRHRTRRSHHKPHRPVRANTFSTIQADSSLSDAFASVYLSSLRAADHC